MMDLIGVNMKNQMTPSRIKKYAKRLNENKNTVCCKKCGLSNTTLYKSGQDYYCREHIRKIKLEEKE